MLYVNFSVKRLKVAPKWSLTYFHSIFAAIFITIAMIKVKLILDLNTLVIVLINYEEFGGKRISFFGLIGGRHSLLMHVAICVNYSYMYLKFIPLPSCASQSISLHRNFNFGRT